MMERRVVVAKPSDLYVPHLRDWRVDRDWTQKQLAEAAGVARGTVVRGEQGGGISPLSAHRLAKALKVTLRELRESLPE